MRLASLIIALATLAGSAPAVAGELAGRVHDARGAPAAGVVLAIPALGVEAVSAADGSYRFADLAAGEHELAVLLEGGAVQHLAASVSAEGTSRRNVFLLARRAVDAARGPQLPGEAALMAEAMRAADALLADADSHGRERRWTDLDG